MPVAEEQLSEAEAGLIRTLRSQGTTPEQALASLPAASGAGGDAGDADEPATRNEVRATVRDAVVGTRAELYRERLTDTMDQVISADPKIGSMPALKEAVEREAAARIMAHEDVKSGKLKGPDFWRVIRETTAAVVKEQREAMEKTFGEPEEKRGARAKVAAAAAAPTHTGAGRSAGAAADRFSDEDFEPEDGNWPATDDEVWKKCDKEAKAFLRAKAG